MTQLRGRYQVALKRLAAVETSRDASNQHELNGSAGLKILLGTERRTRMPARWVILADESEPLIETDTFTWYDSREQHATRSEWRFYYYGEPMILAGDLLCCITREGDETLSLIVARGGATWERQLLLLFGNPDLGSGKFVRGDFRSVSPELAPVAVDLFDILGWLEAPVDTREDDVRAMFAQFGEGFPATRRFSEFARSRVSDVDMDADEILMAWWRKEEALFRAFEDRELSVRLGRTPPFENVEAFLSFSLSIQNRRKSRAGHALENHAAALLMRWEIRAAHNARTEGNRRPDFLLPGSAEYHDEDFPAASLLMLATKTTCKDRWRQILDEAARIPVKHLLTLEAAISPDQLKQMSESGVILVVPRPVLATYTVPRGAQVISVAEFLAHASEVQSRPR